MLLATIVGARSQNSTGFLAGSIVFMIFLPFLYVAVGFIGGIISAAVYNLVAKWSGGIEFTLVDAPQAGVQP